MRTLGKLAEVATGVLFTMSSKLQHGSQDGLAFLWDSEGILKGICGLAAMLVGFGRVLGCRIAVYALSPYLLGMVVERIVYSVGYASCCLEEHYCADGIVLGGGLCY